MNPVTNVEQYLARMSGEDVELPEPLTNVEMYLKKIMENPGGKMPAITIGTVTTGVEPSVTITGTPEAPVLNFVVPHNRMVLS